MRLSYENLKRHDIKGVKPFKDRIENRVTSAGILCFDKCQFLKDGCCHLFDQSVEPIEITYLPSEYEHKGPPTEYHHRATEKCAEVSKIFLGQLLIDMYGDRICHTWTLGYIDTGEYHFCLTTDNYLSWGKRIEIVLKLMKSAQRSSEFLPDGPNFSGTPMEVLEKELDELGFKLNEKKKAEFEAERIMTLEKNRDYWRKRKPEDDAARKRYEEAVKKWDEEHKK